MELTVPYNSPEARQRKKEKENYQLVLSEKGYKSSLVTLEVGALGHSLPQTHSDLRQVLPALSKTSIRRLFDEAGKIAITCSHTILQARSELTWNSNKALQT